MIMYIKTRAKFSILLLVVLILAGCVEEQNHKNAEDSSGISAEQGGLDRYEGDLPQENASSATVDYTDEMQETIWKSVADSASLLPLADNETPVSYFERIYPQAAAEAERYIREEYRPFAENFQEVHGVTKIADAYYQDQRINSLTPGGVFSKNSVCYLVYTLDFSLQVYPGTQPSVAGGMGLDDDGWMSFGLETVLALTLEKDGSPALAFGEQSDIFPDNEKFFPDEFSVLLAKNQAE